MTFKDLFQQKLQAEQEASAAARLEADRALSAHDGLVVELEPKLRALVLEVFAALGSAGATPIDVAGGGTGTRVKAYALGRLDSSRRRGPLEAAVAIDSEGQMALRHEVRADDRRPAGPVSVLGCGALDKGFAQLLKEACRGDEPRRTCVHLNTAGQLMLTEQYIASDDYQYRRTPLAEYLGELAVKAVAGT